MFNCKEEDRKSLYDVRIFDLLALTTEYNTDPLILSSICYLGFQMLTQAKKLMDKALIEKNQVEQKEVYKLIKTAMDKMRDCTNLIEYLSENAFTKAAEQVNSYQSQN